MSQIMSEWMDEKNSSEAKHKYLLRLRPLQCVCFVFDEFFSLFFPVPKKKEDIVSHDNGIASSTRPRRGSESHERDIHTWKKKSVKFGEMSYQSQQQCILIRSHEKKRWKHFRKTKTRNKRKFFSVDRNVLEPDSTRNNNNVLKMMNCNKYLTCPPSLLRLFANNCAVCWLDSRQEFESRNS